MKYATAIKILKKDMKFLGLTLEELLIFSARNPWTVTNEVIKAIEVYNNHHKVVV
jgi:hypothetical protein